MSDSPLMQDQDQDQARRLGRLEGIVEQLDRRLDRIDRRLDSIERRIDWLIGLYIAGVLANVSLFVTILLKLP